MSCPRPRSGLILLAVLVTACGDGGGGAAVRKADTRPGPCARGAATVISRAAGARARTRVIDVSAGQATCVYETPATRVDVMMDNYPQVAFRFMRAVVERGQNAIWSHDPKQNPQLLHGIGGGADWFPGEHQLLTTGRHLLITITVKRPAHGRVALAKRVAKATLASRALPGPGRTLR
jgi:hypothetical protein